MTVKGCPGGHSNFSGEGEWEEDDRSVEEEKNRQGKKTKTKIERERATKKGKVEAKEIDKDRERVGLVDGSHRSQDDLDSWDKYWLPEDEVPKTELCLETR